MTLVKFEGDSPFALPGAQSTAATAQGENVEMTLYILVEGRRTAVYVQMAQRIADNLAQQLLAAAASAHANKSKGQS